MIICFWFFVFFDIVLRILSLNDLTSRRNLVLNSLNSSKKSFLNWWNCSVISYFSVSISWRFSFGSDIHSRFLNVLTITDSFSIKEFNVSVKTSEDISNWMYSFTKLYTSNLPHFCFISLQRVYWWNNEKCQFNLSNSNNRLRIRICLSHFLMMQYILHCRELYVPLKYYYQCWWGIPRA